jgi:uncharacterized repeat protein (TIGR01451 family)
MPMSAVQYIYNAPSLDGQPATEIIYTAPALLTSDITITLPNPNVQVITPATGVTEIQITSPTTAAADFNVFYSSGPGISSNFGRNFEQFGSFPNGSGVRLTIVGPPSFTKAFTGQSVLLNGTTGLTLTITNPANVPLTGLSFTDPLPAGLEVANPNGLANTCGGTVTATANSANVALSGGGVAANSSCSITVNITAIALGMQSNVTTAITSNEGGTGGTASASINVVLLPPGISKSFSPASITLNAISSLTFNLTNQNTVALTGVAFTDSLPSGLVVASPNGLSSTCGGTATATAGSSTISLSGGAIASGGSCTVTATVTAPEGSYLNSVQVTSTNGGTGNTSSATLVVATPPTLSKVFGEVSIGPLSSTTLSFTLMNPNHTVTLDALQFSDTLPAGLVISTPNGLTGSCDGGTITAPAGSNLITLGSATLAPQASCTFSVNVTSTGTVLGRVTNTTSTVTSTDALPGAAASAILFIGDPFQVTYASNLNIGESYIDITNTGVNGASLLGPGFGAATGNICVNVYAFDPSEELIACCSCLITPDQTVNLGVNRDLTAGALTGELPSSVTVKLLATLAGAGGSAASCPQSAATVAGATLANGMAAWGTRLHLTPTAGHYETTEAGFTGATLSPGELASIGGRCASIVGDGSGFGICNSCRAGALGASKLPQ